MGKINEDLKKEAVDYKFRAWEDKKWKTMFYGDIYTPLLEWKANDDLSRAWFVKDWGYPEWVIMQFANIQDKYGEDIYEFDIVDCFLYGQTYQKGVVVFQKGQWLVVVRESSKVVNKIPLHDSALKDLLLCGNIFETPELLRGQLEKKNEKEVPEKLQQ